MPSDATPSRFQPPSLALLWVMRLLAFVPLGISAYLLRLSMEGGPTGPAGCGALPAFDCSHVLASRWSHVVGVPVSAGAVAVYIMILGALAHAGAAQRPERQRAAWQVLIVLAVAVAGAAAWFIILQAFVLGRFCLYCMGAHASGLLLAGMVYWFAPVGPTKLLPDEPDDPMILPWRRAGPLAAMGLAPVLALAVTQIVAAPPAYKVSFGTGRDTDTGPGPDRRLTILGGRFSLPVHELPTLGSPDAKHLIVSLNDYTCPHCRAMHRHLEAALARYGGQLGIVVLPVPLDAACNPHVRQTDPLHKDGCAYVRLALAVFHGRPDKFQQFHEYLYQGDRPPSLPQARARAEQLVGAAGFAQCLADPWVEERLKINIEFYALSGRGVVPKVMVRSVLIEGRPEDAAELFEILEKELGIKPVGAATRAGPGGAE